MSSSKSNKRDNHYTNGLIKGYRSGLEVLVSEQLQQLGINPNYESFKLDYIKPETRHKYTPDFFLKKRDGTYMCIETKGRFVLEDRKKMILIRDQHPDVDFRFVFTYSRGKINKGSKTTYADWCDKNGFKYADKVIPDDWIKELEDE